MNKLGPAGAHSPFGEMLLRYRMAAGLSQAGLASASGMSVRALRDLERGRASAPQERSAELLATALGLERDERTSFLMLAKEGRRRIAVMENRTSLLALPAVGDLVGREAELRRLAQDAGTAGVVVITGPPGVGKTSLAVAAAGGLASQFPDGCLALDLRGVDDRPMTSAVALERMLTSLGVTSGQMPVTADERGSLFRTLLRDRRLLLILDNATDEAQVRPLLTMSEGSLTIVTSRRVLAGLESARWMVLDVLPAESAVDLVGSIVGEELVKAEADAARELVSLCGCLPLAVRIVSNRLATRQHGSIAELVRQMGDERRRLDSLSVGDLHPRAAFEVSYRMLPARARLVFRRLAVIPGVHFDDELAAVATGVPAEEIGLLLDELVEMSLLNTTAAPIYFQFHDLLRLFARERWVEEEPEHVRDELRDVLYAHVLERGSAAGALFFPEVIEVPQDSPFGSHEEANEWLEQEVTTWSAVQREAAALGWHKQVYDFAWSMHRYSIGRAQHRWDEVFELGLRAARAMGDRIGEAEMLTWAGTAQRLSAGDSERALEMLREASALAQELDLHDTALSIHSSIGQALASLGRVDEALEHSRLAHEMSKGYDFFGWRVWMSVGLGTALLAAGRLQESLDLHTALLAEAENRRDEAGPELAGKVMVLLLTVIGDALAGLGRWPEAAQSYHDARSRYGAGQANFRNEAELALGEGVAWRQAGETERARTCLTFALDRLDGLADSVTRKRVEAELALLPD
ncbi:NB-ARC domain-containing protein [Lentzea flava]|uniref:HTH cro/C1-type domain-containing protein n=1 Tax=Lentzea flava TaxID=103732 RepID=A0ABQ2VJW1_9PSEU|nr:NB-ARC domain-containing protein [Lentzea flava]MCP2205454.1 ATP-dependent transcriptional regulator [Lentzea flava]GGU86946.1 hypothetical protein GCM10010178_91070 [Lentzea flava]